MATNILQFATRRPEWLEKAARDAAHRIVLGELRCGPDHSAACNRATEIIIQHMSAAMALARIDPLAGDAREDFEAQRRLAEQAMERD